MGGGHRALLKVENERYCYIFFIFGVGIAGTGAGKTSNVNNSALGGHRALPKVANDRYCYIFFYFWGRHRRHRPLAPAKFFFSITQLWVVTERSRRWQMKGIAIYFLFLGSTLPAPTQAPALAK